MGFAGKVKRNIADKHLSDCVAGSQPSGSASVAGRTTARSIKVSNAVTFCRACTGVLAMTPGS